MADIFDELVGNGAPPEELIAQLRKQRTLGQLGALSGDKRIAGLGGNVAQDSMNTAVDLRNRKDKSQAREDQQAFSRWQQEQAMQGRKDQLGLQRESLAQARAIAEAQMGNQREIARLRASTAQAAANPFDKARQQKIGTESADWDTSGKIQTQAALNDIDQAIGGLSSDKSIGNSKTAWLPFDQNIRAVTDPEGLRIQRLANRVTVENLRNTFGSQFTQSEGDQFKALDYDPQLSNEANLANLRKKKAMIESHIKRKNALFGQYRKDALPDFEGQTMNTLSDEDIVNSIMQGQL
jgi:hypothetical protein